jgi:ubiquinol-cytochrome c reductase iron-sulfur subunit
MFGPLRGDVFWARHFSGADLRGKDRTVAATTAGTTRRDFLYIATAAVGAVGGAAALWPLINQMNPDASVLALASADVDLTPIAEGQSITIKWRGKPVFVTHRTKKEIEEARAVALNQLPDPQPDQARVKEGHDQWLVLIGVCTHLGCVPLGQRSGDPKGDYDGWFCPCHGSHYDTSGRIRRGPAPLNLAVPPYEFLSDTSVRIG